ncbi:hypothetical protein STCU_03536 [Strigomonas culicis]|uniref:Uncharacterized protein n=1 Tax=Strigomonas culicis TaxID=28005 RepID=S9UR61_9TRYP|nr:hypothetical protein STCU_03536 [Strigomonas culicis]|eukprot:EPY31274.1 hypothetical protein STCU_03536 [Strigomonas culicis]
MNESVEDLQLVISVFKKLLGSSPDSTLRHDQLDPLVVRLERVAASLSAATQQKGTNNTSSLDAAAENVASPTRRTAKKADPRGVGASSKTGNVLPNRATKVVTKPSALIARPVPRESAPTDHLMISKGVARSLTCTLYNILEGTVRLVRGTSGSIFIRRDDDMLSIVNVNATLSFPPQLVNHRCLGSLDMDVMSSGIALNRRVNSGAPSHAVPLLIFPVYAISSLEAARGDAMATIHIEKASRVGSFDVSDEGMLYHAACIVGELFSRVPQMDWVEHFYDPVTQHIIAPFDPQKSVRLPPLKASGDGVSEDSAVHAELMKKITASPKEALVKREALPLSHTMKAVVQGLSPTPTLREVGVYLENMQDSWKKGVTNTVKMAEEDRSSQVEMKILRRQLLDTQGKLDTATEQLRLYQLNTDDYKTEYGGLREELNAYLHRKEN